MTDRRFNPTIFEEVFGAAVIAGSILASPILRPWYSKWGTADTEINMPLPGDELVTNPWLESTRAISIQAPASAVWPWLVQMGQGRGGLYSYERLENLAGCDIHNSDRIMPEHQDLKVGDKVRLGPEGFPAFDVSAIEPERSLVLVGLMPGESKPSTWVWNFYLNPVNKKATRLILRSRFDCEPKFSNTLIWRVFTDPIAFNMERKMLQGIKARTEAAASN